MHNFQSLVTKRNSLNTALKHLKSTCQHLGTQLSDSLVEHLIVNQSHELLNYDIHVSNFGLEEFFNKFNGKEPSISSRRFLDQLSKMDQPSNIKLASKDNVFLAVFTFLNVESRLKVTISQPCILSSNTMAKVDLELFLPNGDLLFHKSLEQPMPINDLKSTMYDLEFDDIRLDFNYHMQLEYAQDYVDRAIFELFIVDSLLLNDNLDRHSGIFGVLSLRPIPFNTYFIYPGAAKLAEGLKAISKIELARRISVLADYTKFYLGESDVENIELAISQFALSCSNIQERIEFFASADLYKVNIGTSNSTFIAKHIDAIEEIKGCLQLSSSLESVITKIQMSQQLNSITPQEQLLTTSNSI
tara:strand:- start:99944 stop:101020 length:1077 start_codon:yes stop_codon:yes gene_type:complete